MAPNKKSQFCTHAAQYVKVKETRQWNLASQKNITREIFFFKNQAENEPVRLFPDLLPF